VTQNSSYSSGCKCNSRSWYFISKDLGEEIPHCIRSSIKAVDDKPRQSGMCKIISMTLSNCQIYEMVRLHTYLFINIIFQESPMIQKSFGDVSVDGMTVLRIPFITLMNVCASLLFERRPPVTEIFPKLWCGTPSHRMFCATANLGLRKKNHITLTLRTRSMSQNEPK